MKKNIVLLTLALLGSLSTYAQVNFGVKAGFSGASMKVTGSEAPDLKMRPAFHVGVIADFQLAEGFYLQPALLFSAKGAKSEETVTVQGVKVSTETKINLNYLELPVNFLYKHEMGSGKLFGGFGPYLGYGLSGKVKVKATANGNSHEEEEKVKFDGKKADDGKAHLKALDAGANFIAGYELKNGLLFSVNYSLGLVNIDPYDDEKTKNRYFGISVGYLLNRKK